MKIWVTRHGQTNLNKNHLMQGLTDEPLNATGIAQAKAARERIADVTFDAVYASPLDRAIHTASVIGNVDPSEVIIDPRIIETDFGKYEKAKYYLMGPAMTLYWARPEWFPAPKGVETVASMVKRSSAFLKELEEKGYENVLVACHGGIIRALCGYLEDRPNGIKWRPKPHNCEIRVYESVKGKHRFVASYSSDGTVVADPAAIKTSAPKAGKGKSGEKKGMDKPVEAFTEEKTTDSAERFCACCGAPIEEKYEICDVCGWEDDPVQNKDPEFAGGANEKSLNEYRAAYLASKTNEATDVVTDAVTEAEHAVEKAAEAED